MTENSTGFSVKRRLLLILLSTVALAWLVTVVLSYIDAGREVDELLDAHLAQSAALLAAQVGEYAREDEEHEEYGDNAESEPFDDGHQALPYLYSRQVVFQIWERGSALRLHSANAPAQRLSADAQGFSETLLEGERWRVFSLWSRARQFLIQVGERHAIRERIALSIAGHLLQPLLIALPVLALLIWLGVSRGLRPLSILGSQVAQRRPDNLTPLEMTNAPVEIAPLVANLNRLFARLRISLENERRFTADAAHELRTPLAALKTQAQVAHASGNDSKRRRALDQVITGCDRCAHLLDQLLTLARLEPETLLQRALPCDLRALAATVIGELAPPALARAIDIELNANGPAAVHGDAGLLRILLRNLIDNAVRYSPDNSLVGVTLERRGDQIRLSVSDQGPGLTAQQREQVWQRFYRVLGSHATGSGLGLSIVKRIAEIHQADVALEAGPGERGLCASVMFAAPGTAAKPE